MGQLPRRSGIESRPAPTGDAQQKEDHNGRGDSKEAISIFHIAGFEFEYSDGNHNSPDRDQDPELTGTARPFRREIHGSTQKPNQEIEAYRLTDEKNHHEGGE